MSTFEIKMPKPGESITEGTIISWSVKTGDLVEEDDILFEVNTAKVSVEVPSPVTGKVIEIRFNEGDSVPVGTVVAVIEIGEEGDNQTTDFTPEEKESISVSEEKIDNKTLDIQSKNPDPNEKLSKGSEDRWYSPVVLEKAKEANIDKAELDVVPGTGY